jgi:hypothetical protein
MENVFEWNEERKNEGMNEIKERREQYDSGGGRVLSYYITWTAAF